MDSSKYRVLFLNPPNKLTIARRYMCAYHSPVFLLPPHDLIQLASCIYAWNHVQVVLLDAIAQRDSETTVHAFIEQGEFDMLVALVGVETYGEDMACLTRIKEAFPGLLCVVFGYYPTLFPEETLIKGHMDFVLCGEPEFPLSRCLQALSSGGDVTLVPGLAGLREDQSVFSAPGERVTDLDALPLPDYSLVNIHLYAEAFLGKPCGAILSSRGCSFGCTYCTTTYGRHLVFTSPERVVDEIQHLQAAGVNFVRFLDDTFTVNRARVIAVCNLLIQRGIQMPWACLSRIDTLDREMLQVMARAGCKRILVGVESYSQRILDLLNKRVNVDHINSQLLLIREAGIEVFGFFLVGGPLETKDDFSLTLRGIMSAPLDFAGVNPMTPYAGTLFFEKIEKDVNFSLFPYQCDYRDPAVNRETQMRKRLLYLRFYLRPSIILRHLRVVVTHPLLAIRLLITLVR